MPSLPAALRGVTGLLTLLLRSTPAMGPMLILHLGVLGGLYVTFPYGKLVRAVYRYAALVRFHVESEAQVLTRREAEASAASPGRAKTLGALPQRPFPGRAESRPVPSSLRSALARWRLNHLPAKTIFGGSMLAAADPI